MAQMFWPPDRAKRFIAKGKSPTTGIALKSVVICAICGPLNSEAAFAAVRDFESFT